MTSVTIRVLEGMEQGRVFARLQLPVSVGREEENSIQLNDDRISRFHAKLQDHSGRVILTDLGSTNGTRVNGHPVQMRILQTGDVISVGRCLLLLSERSEEDDEPTRDDPDTLRTRFLKKSGRDGITIDDDSDSLDAYFPPESLIQPAVDLKSTPSTEPATLFPKGRPELPSELNSLQRVQLSDLLAFIHEKLGHVVKQGVEDLEVTSSRTIQCDWETWSQLVLLQSDLADCICKINNPES
jgi:pSer/pThr/pTyr-binding forkhead associated (FHA) protein